jgi:signal transduction histidine kinase
MFTSFARRLTSWYVVAATVLVALVLSAFAALALAFYIRLINDGIDDGARAATLFASRAAARRDTFVKAASEFEVRDHHSGVRVVATQFPPLPPGDRRGDRGAMVLRPGEAPPGGRRYERPADRDEHAILSVVDGQVIHADPRSLRLGGSRFGFAVATLFGSHFVRVPFLDGTIFFAPDPQAVESATIVLLVGILLVSAAAGCLAWFSGRYITSQALRPLYDVTAALQRFAARDFTPQPIAVAGKSDFDAVALAYNAAAAQVAAAFAEREQAENQMRQFVADAGHELRTPLTIVLGYIDLLRRRVEAGDERSRRIFAAIGSEGARMRTLIDNLVLLARMEGSDERPVEPFRLAPLIGEIVDARRIVAPGVRFDLHLDADATVIGNRDEIHEAIANVVDNALKYAPGSPIRIKTSAFDGNAIEVGVTDYGPGILPEDRAGIFERFYRGATRGDVEGSGLGLAIAKRALERAGGELLLVDTSASGTTFALRMRTDGSPTATAQPRTTTA